MSRPVLSLATFSTAMIALLDQRDSFGPYAGSPPIDEAIARIDGAARELIELCQPCDELRAQYGREFHLDTEAATS